MPPPFLPFTFLIRQPQPSSADIAMDVCVHSSQQLSNSTVPAFVPTSLSLLQRSRGEHALLPQPCTRFDQCIPRHAREMLTAGVWPWMETVHFGARPCTGTRTSIELDGINQFSPISDPCLLLFQSLTFRPSQPDQHPASPLTHVKHSQPEVALRTLCPGTSFRTPLVTHTCAQLSL